MTIVWTAHGADDFLAALTYLHDRNHAAAVRLIRAVNAAVERLHELPLEGVEIRLASGEIVRSWPVPPFRIYYQRRGRDVLVVRLYDQRREPIERR